MIGAIVGDVAGSRFEFNNHKSKEFDLFVTCKPFDKFTEETVNTMREFGRMYPLAGQWEGDP